MLQSQWYPYLRAILELLYFLAGLGIAVVVYLGLQQLKLTKKLADASNKREAVKLAAQQCKYFAEHVVPAISKVMEECIKHKISFLLADENEKSPSYAVKDGKFIHNNFDMKLLRTQIPNVETEMVTFLNAVESFAIPFAAGVADDDIGFQETAAAFCLGLNRCMPALFFQFKTQGAGYPSALKLYGLWNDRRKAQAIADAKSAQALIEETGKKRIDLI